MPPSHNLYKHVPQLLPRYTTYEEVSITRRAIFWVAIGFLLVGLIFCTVVLLLILKNKKAFQKREKERIRWAERNVALDCWTGSRPYGKVNGGGDGGVRGPAPVYSAPVRGENFPEVVGKDGVGR